MQMSETFKILKLSKLFIKRALFPHLLNKYVLKTITAEEDLLQESEKFDIKDEELFNQFESFMDAYKEFLESLEIDPDNLEQEGMDESAELIDTLNTRYHRIMNNSYLDMNLKEGYDEDFNPGELTNFIQKVVEDAERRIKNIAGDDINISELRAAQFAKEFNQLQEKHEEGKKEEWSAKKIESALAARKEYFSKLMFIKKVGKSHPDYAKYERYIESRKNSYLRIMQDPAAKEKYRVEAKNRQSTWRKKIDSRMQEILEIIKNTRDPKKIKELQDEISKLEAERAKRKQQGVEIATNLRERKKEENMSAFIIHLTQKLATTKNEIKKTLKAAAKNDPYFVEFKERLSEAEKAFKENPSPANQQLLEDAKKADKEAIENHTNVIKVKNDLIQLYAYRDKIKQLNELKWFDSALPESGKPIVQELIGEGGFLVENYSRTYRSPCKTISDIIYILTKALNNE